MTDNLFIIDTSGPFFLKYSENFINWSKVPYSSFEKNGKLHKRTHKNIKSNFEKFIKKINRIGYNAISIDDLRHIVFFDFYHLKLRIKLKKYQKRFKKLFHTAKKYNLKIFITSDIMFFNEEIEKFTKNDDKKIIYLLKLACEDLFSSFPEVNGIIFRIGESDGIDVKGDFKSKVVIKTPKQANNYFTSLLPVFEKYNKQLILRTWTTGAYKIGDIMWNTSTFRKTFNNINSENFIISLKYGESDFFRFLELNPHFFDTNHKKIIELQTRREYEGFGEFPSFVGWDYKKYYDKLKNLNNLSGIHVWCQTGGWSSFKNYTFLKNTSFWNEINTYVTLKIFKDKLSVENAVTKFFKGKNPDLLMKFLKLSNDVINELLYDPEFTKYQLYFNKLRIPPILHIFWDNVTVTNAVITFYNTLNKSGQKSTMHGFKALKKLEEMNEINKILKLPYNFKFQYNTFKIIALCRALIYSNEKEIIKAKIDALIKKYSQEYPGGYKFYINVTDKYNTSIVKTLIRLSIRKKRNYRLVDRILFNRITKQFFLFGYKMMKKDLPQFLGNQAMPIKSFFK